MLRLGLALLLTASLAAAASTSATATAGGEQIILQNGHGFAKLVARGAFLGKIKGRGRITATEDVAVHHYRSKKQVGEHVFRYHGRRMSLFVQNGSRWRVKILGARIFAGGPTVRGCFWLDAADAGQTGTYSVEGQASHAWPRQLTGPLRVGSAKC